MNRRDAEAQRLNKLSGKIIGACIEIHRALGPGLLESLYEECLCHELRLQQLAFERQKPLPVSYKGVDLDCGYRLDVLVENSIIVELKTVDHLMPIHTAQVLTYLKITDLRLGLLINFNVPVLWNGVRRVVNNFPELDAAHRYDELSEKGRHPFQIRDGGEGEYL